MTEKSLVEFAYDCISGRKDPITFKELIDFVFKKASYEGEPSPLVISRFYTNLSLDGRFIVDREKNVWDLKDRYSYKDTRIDTEAAYSDLDTQDEDIEEVKEQKEEEKMYSGEEDTSEDNENNEEENENKQDDSF